MHRFVPTIILVLTCLLSQAQPVVHLDSLPAGRVLTDNGASFTVLNEGWTYHTGDNPAYAAPDFDAAGWARIDPTKDIFDLPQLDKNGQIGWFRLRFTPDSALNRPLAMRILQSGASEIYLNGRLIHRIGRIGATPAETEAFTPNGNPLSFPASGRGVQVLAVRYALQPSIGYGGHFGTTNVALAIELNTTEGATNAQVAKLAQMQNGRLYAGAFGLMGILFLTFYFFFPGRKESLYFALYALLMVAVWYPLNSIKIPVQKGLQFQLNNAFLVGQTIAYLFRQNSFYIILNQKRGWAFWGLVGFGIVSIICGIYVRGWGWILFGIIFSNLINFDSTRIAILAMRRKQQGVWMLLTGEIIYLLAWFLFSLSFSGVFRNTSFIDLFSISILSVPVSFAVFFGYDFGIVNRSLRQKITEVESLSAEKQQILSNQNETLERQVAERTAELAQKNRELEIEAALDRIRATSLAMRHPDELKHVVAVLFDKLNELGLVFDGGAAIHVFTEGSKDAAIWVVSPQQLPTKIDLPFDAEAFVDNPIIEDVWQAKETGSHLLNRHYSFEQKNRYFRYVFKHNNLTKIPQVGRDFILNAPNYTASFVAEKNSLLGANSWTGQLFSELDFTVLKRVAQTFEQAYVRFLDLQKAEASTKEAIRQASLDRIRAEIASMSTVADLQRITPTIWNELTTLAIPFIRCGVFIMDDTANQIHTFLSNGAGEAIGSFHLDYAVSQPITDMVAHWHRRQLYTSHWSLDDLGTLADSVVQQGAAASRTQYLVGLPSAGIYPHFFPFPQGMLYVGSTHALTTDDRQTVQAMAGAFATAYARYEDFSQLEMAKQQVDHTLAELRSTQQQLIQKEKLASLGELTAGIAHEIQNPLNFVNNFAQVSSELVDDLKTELAKGDTAEVKLLADDLRQNLEKITHHGQRASGIVRGMLEHSRASSGERQPTDLNALADEYLRLAYHGLKAKEKPGSADRFSCELVTDFAPDLPLVEVMAPDLGRVLLNLFNNAFYAMQQRAKQGEAGYQPTLTLTTRLLESGPANRPERGTSPAQSTGLGVEIRVQDNGTGIPEAVQAKIFQPFFTTKPTGEGTGLGLSLSYDIITKGHGGTLAVESTAGEGTTFIIHLPIG